MRGRSLSAATLMAATLLTVTPVVGYSSARAQDMAPNKVASMRAQRVAAKPPVTYRGLTINRQPQTPSDTPGDDRDIYQDGPIRYNDIRDFSPSPYTTSGVEYPYGLDGIGGYGSDLGFASGQDSALYNRGAGSLQ